MFVKATAKQGPRSVPSAGHRFSYHLEIVKMMLKWGRVMIIYQFQSTLRIFHCWIWPGLFVLIYHIPAIKCRSRKEAAWSLGSRCDSEENLQRFRTASWFALCDPKSPLIYLFSIITTIKYEHFAATRLTSPPVKAHLEISSIVLQGTYEASL